MGEMQKLLTNSKSSICNICRNFKSILDPSHRKSKVHQRKLNEKFSVIRAKMKEIKPNCICIHDEEWYNGETIFCYFCNEPISKHEVYDGVTVEYLGYLRHLTSASHQNGVMNYLKFHGRKEDFKIFCKPQSLLNTFIDSISDAKRKYLEKLETLNQQDIKKIQDIQAEREKLVREFSQEYSCQQVILSTKTTCYAKANEQFPNVSKIPPWQLPKSEGNNSEKCGENPVIGPTMDTLAKHVNSKKKKKLPPTRLQTHKNMRKKEKLNKKWLPPFSGVWNKGRTRHLKHEMKKRN